MGDDSKIARHEVTGVSEENRELFRRAISEAMSAKLQKIERDMRDIPTPPPSKRHKIRMNRLCRECTGGLFVPFPEEE